MRRVLVCAGIAVMFATAVPASLATTPTVTATGTHVFADAFGGSTADTLVEVVENTADLTIPVRGGAFTGSGHLLYRHTISNEFCERGVYETPIDLVYTGTYSPANDHMLIGRLTIFVTPTTQWPGCPDFGFTYNGPELKDRVFEAQLDPGSGHVTEIEGVYGFDVTAGTGAFDVPPISVEVAVGNYTDVAMGDLMVDGDETTTVTRSDVIVWIPPSGGFIVGEGTIEERHETEDCAWTVRRLALIHGTLDGPSASGTSSETTEAIPGECSTPDRVQAPESAGSVDWMGSVSDGTFESSELGIIARFLVDDDVDMGDATPVDATLTPPVGVGDIVVEFTQGMVYIADAALVGGTAQMTTTETDGDTTIKRSSTFDLAPDGTVQRTDLDGMFFGGSLIDVNEDDGPGGDWTADLEAGFGTITLDDGSTIRLDFTPIETAGPDDTTDSTTTTLGGPIDGAPLEAPEEGGGTNLFLIVSAFVAAVASGWAVKFVMDRRKAAPTPPSIERPPEVTEVLLGAGAGDFAMPATTVKKSFRRLSLLQKLDWIETRAPSIGEMSPEDLEEFRANVTETTRLVGVGGTGETAQRLERIADAIEARDRTAAGSAAGGMTGEFYDLTAEPDFVEEAEPAAPQASTPPAEAPPVPESAEDRIRWVEERAPLAGFIDENGKRQITEVIDHLTRDLSKDELSGMTRLRLGAARRAVIDGDGAAGAKAMDGATDEYRERSKDTGPITPEDIKRYLEGAPPPDDPVPPPDSPEEPPPDITEEPL